MHIGSRTVDGRALKAFRACVDMRQPDNITDSVLRLDVANAFNTLRSYGDDVLGRTVRVPYAHRIMGRYVGPQLWDLPAPRVKRVSGVDADDR